MIIPTFNCSSLLKQAIDSALSQTYPQLEVIVVDDGSTDDTETICATFGTAIRYFRQLNRGTPAARNTGLSHAKGKYIALLDHDDLWLETKVEKQVSAMEHDSSIGMCHTGGRVVDLRSGQITSTYLPAAELDYHAILSWCSVGCATAMIRRETLELAGGFDETLKGVDDWDLWIRIGWHSRIVGLREVLAEIREHGSNQGKRYERMFPIVNKCIKKPRPFHAGCRQCSKAIQIAKSRLRQDYYVKACRLSRVLLRDKKFFSGLLIRLKAHLMYPESLLNPLWKILPTK